jgi:prepilin-type N-terminal cleavage/methylation domain-containing protein
MMSTFRKASPQICRMGTLPVPSSNLRPREFDSDGRGAHPTWTRAQRCSMRWTRPHRCDKHITNPRLGFSLIEMMVVISILTVMISLVGTTFHLLLRTEKLVSQSFVTERSISSLAVQFRNDVHQAETGVVTGDASTGHYLLVLGDSVSPRVRYEISPASLVRFLVDGDQVVSREDYRLPECRVSIEGVSELNPLLRSLMIQRPGATIVQKEQMPRPLRSLRIDAFLHRFDWKNLANGDGKDDADSTEALK